ncbi:hypothetical protein C1H46_008254 [Malus baccata]|uniref:Uncharacterized protein n=1 Tax=Malus baccata TaxID=106549 RepID=A0A540N590_MALBA|nr:hypothetical protein C1H46_008254 [Malus baccata]
MTEFGMQRCHQLYFNFFSLMRGSESYVLYTNKPNFNMMMKALMGPLQTWYSLLI